MKQAGLFHGSGGHGGIFWLPYLRENLEARGWYVASPDLPDSDAPDLDSWLKAAEEALNLSEETVLVGHSLGCPLIMSMLQRANIKIQHAVLVAGPYNKKRFSDLEFLEEYDWSAIKQNCSDFTFVHSDNDPWGCDEEEANLAFRELGGKKVVISGQEHFGSGTFNQEYPEFPLLLKLITD